MPTLIASGEGGSGREFEITKSVTSIGRDLENDLRFDTNKLAGRHAHVLRDSNGYRVFAAQGAKIFVNGKRREEWLLSDGDKIEMGGLELTYRSSARSTLPPEGSTTPRDPAERIRLEAFQKLYAFTARLNASPTFEALKRNLVDAVVALAEADTGVMLLLDAESHPKIDVARDRLGNDLPAGDTRISDSIIAEVLTSKRALIVPDAQEDALFSGSRSVINYRIRSVIAVPILRADDALGVLYLGSDRVTNNFSQDFLEVLMVFGAQAGLLVTNALLIKELREDNQTLKAELARGTFGELIGGSAPMLEVFRTISRLAPADISVLVVGETGTGKELIARELHRRSGRNTGPFVAINVAAIPENLLEAELFGYVKGAFTGAIADKKGKFMAAHGGTLFLDEIGDMPLGLQAKLLRVLQERTLERIGSNQPQPLDIRVVCATHRDLEAMQVQGAFRPDLFFRLNEAQINLPPLRERGEDITLLGNYFFLRYRDQLNPRIRRLSEKCVAGMKRYPWPGNVREMEAKIKKAFVMSDGHEIDLADLGIEGKAMEEIIPLKDAKEIYARQYIQEVLALNNGNRTKTARDLDIDPRTVFNYLQKKD